MNAATKLYEHFEPPERFTLTLQALARGDDTEAERLTGSCPRRSYTMRDAGFTERVDTALHITSVACIDLRCLWGKLDLLHWVLAVVRASATHQHIVATMAFLDGSFHGRGRPQMEFFAGRTEDEVDASDGGSDDAEAEKDDDSPRLSSVMEGDLARRMAAVEDRSQAPTDRAFVELLKAAHDIAQQLTEVWTAYDRFCHDQLGVSAAVMLEAWEFPTGREVTEVLALNPRVTPDPAKVEEYLGLYRGAWDIKFGEES